MHPSPASNLLNRRSLTAYGLYFREEQRRLFQEPYEARNDRNRRPLGTSHNGKVAFRDLVRKVSSNWKGLQPGVKESYGKLAAIQRRQYDMDYDKVSKHVWKNHQKVAPVTVPIGIPCLGEDYEINQVVDDVLAELKVNEPSAKETNLEQPGYWPLIGCSTPIANLIRSQSYPQHVLNHKNTCLPCTTIARKPHIETLKQSLDLDGRDFCLKALLCED